MRSLAAAALLAVANLLARETPQVSQEDRWYLVPTGRWIVQAQKTPPAIGPEDVARLQDIHNRFQSAMAEFRHREPNKPLQMFLRTPLARQLWQQQRQVLIEVYHKTGLHPAEFSINTSTGAVRRR